MERQEFCNSANPWELYDKLIQGIPEDIVIEGVVVGLSWTVVYGGKYCGTAMTVRENLDINDGVGEVSGKSFKEVASMVKSWNFAEAAIGMGAINAYYNHPDTFAIGEKNQGGFRVTAQESTFEDELRLEGKKIAAIGHFPQVDKLSDRIGQLSIIERRPQKGDFPDSACEYLLPFQDYVFITGSAWINKTMPRLLCLSRGAKTIMVGPSSPMAPILFESGVQEIAGFVVEDREKLIKSVASGGHKPLFGCGQRRRMISINQEEF